MTLEGAITKVKKVSQGDGKFNEHDFQDLINLLKELKAKRDEELKSLGYRMRHDKTFTFTYYWTKGDVCGHNHKTGKEQEVYCGTTILDAVNQYVNNVLTRGYSTSVIEYYHEGVIEEREKKDE